MPVRYTILDRFSIVYIQYSGVATVAEATEAFTRYFGDAARKPGQRHFVDLSALRRFDVDFASLFRFQALKAAALAQDETPTMMLYLAPTRVSLKMAHQILRSWEGLDGAIIRLAEDWDGAMDIFGLPRKALDPLLIRTA